MNNIFQWAIYSPQGGKLDILCTHPEDRYPNFEDKIILLHNYLAAANTKAGKKASLIGEDCSLVLLNKKNDDSNWKIQKRFRAGEQFP